jgi:hypothetical protein
VKDGGCRCIIGRLLGGFAWQQITAYTVDQCCLPIDLYHSAKNVAELDNGEYSEWKCSPEDIVMPMCRSPQISDALLRPSKLPANDNRPAVRISIRSSRESKRTAKAGRQAILILCVATLLLL